VYRPSECARPVVALRRCRGTPGWGPRCPRTAERALHSAAYASLDLWARDRYTTQWARFSYRQRGNSRYQTSPPVQCYPHTHNSTWIRSANQPPQWLWEITHTHPLNGPLFRTTRVSRYQKVKRIWILQKQEKVSGSGISWAICKSAPRSRQRQSTKDCDRLLVQNFHMAICIPMPATVVIGFQPVFSEQLQAEERSLPLSQ